MVHVKKMYSIVGVLCRCTDSRATFHQLELRWHTSIKHPLCPKVSLDVVAMEVEEPTSFDIFPSLINRFRIYEDFLLCLSLLYRLPQHGMDDSMDNLNLAYSILIPLKGVSTS